MKYESFDNNIWECACGNGNLSKRLEKFGYNVRSTDLIYHGFGDGEIDFLKCDEKFDGDIITNPPFKYATEFCKKAVKLSKRRVAMFLRIQFLESKKRYVELYRENPPYCIYVFVKRISCYKNNIISKQNNAICFCWFVWDKEYKGETKIRWIDNL